jgi:hypothetical protein
MSAAVEAGIDLITDPSLAMCAFHSARIISRLGLPPLGNLPQDQVIERLQACADALEEQAKLYPTTAILRSGALDLIHDAQRSPRGSSPARSGWDSGEGSDEQNAASRDVYSKYSVTEEIRKLKFRTDDSGEGMGDNIVNGTAQQHTNQREVATISGNLSEHNISTLRSLHPEAAFYQGHEAGMSSIYHNVSMLGSQHLANASGYDAAMTLGFDPRYDNSQPDIFLDSFWPTDAQEEWWIGPGGNNIGGTSC